MRVWVGGHGAGLGREALRGLGPGFGSQLRSPGSRAERALAALGCAAPEGLALGPLAAASFGRWLEAREVGFALSLGSVGADGKLADPGPVTPDEAREAADLASRLGTGRLSLLFGLGADHAMVLGEGSTDLETTEWAEAVGQDWQAALPKGDGEAQLRRLVDDSVNVLAGSEANRRRADDGRPPLCVLWPWAPGWAVELPRLVLRYGAPVRVESEDWAVQGAARLAGVSLRGEAPLEVRSGPFPWERTDDPEEQEYLAGQERESGWLRGTTVACAQGPTGWHNGFPEGTPWDAALEEGSPEPAVALSAWVDRLLREGTGPVG